MLRSRLVAAEIRWMPAKQSKVESRCMARDPWQVESKRVIANAKDKDEGTTFSSCLLFDLIVFQEPSAYSASTKSRLAFEMPLDVRLWLISMVIKLKSLGSLDAVWYVGYGQYGGYLGHGPKDGSSCMARAP